MSERIIGEREFTDGVTRPVFEDDEGQQYVLDDDAVAVCGLWLGADEPTVGDASASEYPRDQPPS
jgi:hypothetical protein